MWDAWDAGGEHSEHEGTRGSVPGQAVGGEGGGELSREDRGRRRAAKKRRAGKRQLEEAATPKQKSGANIISGEQAAPARLSGRK